MLRQKSVFTQINALSWPLSSATWISPKPSYLSL